MNTSRIEARTTPVKKKQYEKHALAVHGMKLATWVKWLMAADYRKHSKN